MNSSTWTIDEILTGTATLGQSKPGSNGNEEILHIPKNSRTEASPSDGLASYPGHSLEEGVPTPLQRCSWHILQSQITGLTIIDTNIYIYIERETNKNFFKELFYYYTESIIKLQLLF